MKNLLRYLLALPAFIVASMFGRRRKLPVEADQTSATVDAAQQMPTVATAAASTSERADKGSADTGETMKSVPAEVRSEMDIAPVAVEDHSEASASSPETISLLDVVVEADRSVADRSVADRSVADRSVADRFASYPLPDSAQESSSAAVFETKLVEESGEWPHVDAGSSTTSKGEVDAGQGGSELPPLLDELVDAVEAVADSAEFENVLPPLLVEDQEEPHLDLSLLPARHRVAQHADGADEAEPLEHGFPPAEAPIDPSLYDFAVDAVEPEVELHASFDGQPVEVMTLPPVLEDEAPGKQSAPAESDLPPPLEPDVDDQLQADMNGKPFKIEQLEEWSKKNLPQEAE